MMPNEMSNEELASRLEKVLPGNYYIVEAAERLRKMNAMEVALNIEVGMNKAAAEMTVKQKRMLSVMEKRIKMLASSGSSNPDWYRCYAREALACIESRKDL